MQEFNLDQTYLNIEPYSGYFLGADKIHILIE